jgi:hypothetical protein
MVEAEFFPWVRKKNEGRQTGVETVPMGPIELCGQSVDAS